MYACNKINLFDLQNFDLIVQVVFNCLRGFYNILQEN